MLTYHSPFTSQSDSFVSLIFSVVLIIHEGGVGPDTRTLDPPVPTLGFFTPCIQRITSVY